MHKISRLSPTHRVRRTRSRSAGRTGRDAEDAVPFQPENRIVHEITRLAGKTGSGSQDPDYGQPPRTVVLITGPPHRSPRPLREQASERAEEPITRSGGQPTAEHADGRPTARATAGQAAARSTR